MKIQSPDIPHKSEVGGVRVNIAHQGRGVPGLRALLDNARKHRPNAAIQGVLVGPMAKKGVEIIVGTLLDATFGPMVMVGLGGITTELFRDVIYRPAPVRGRSGGDAGGVEGRALAEWISRRGESGCGGAVAVDLGGVGAGGAAADEIAEIELNPVLVHPQGQGVTIVDALVVRKK